jgi:2-amino-4-hydroxy-6-hydroxymethyldihydropteridine diphosphokinase
MMERPNAEPLLYYLGLGANLGDPAAQLDRAVEELSRQAAGPVRASSIVQSPPWDGSDQPDYLNLAVEAPLRASPREVLEMVLSLERALGRPVERPKWAARVLDIDLLLVAGVVVRQPDLTLPHPLYRERLFAIQPLAELAPNLTDPETGETMTQLFQKLQSRETPLSIFRPRPGGS